MPLTQEDLQVIKTEVGSQATAAMKAELDKYDAKAKQFAQEIVDKKGAVTPEDFAALKSATDEAFEKANGILVKQGTTLAEMQTKLGDAEAGTKSIAQVISEDLEEHKKIFEQGQGRKTYMVRMNSKGLIVARPFKETDKTTGSIATIDGIPAGAVASISQALDSATLLRVGAGSPIMSQYRNSPWLFDLCNTINASFNGSMPFAMWYDEQQKVGASAKVLEGGAKPLVQYLYELMSDTYKKESALISFTDEFHMDFAQLESDILGKGRTDVINRVNSAILPDIKTKATAYNTGDSFKQLVGVPDANDFDALAAMAAQVDNVTFGAIANAAIMSTFKKYRMGVTKNDQGSYLNPPAVLDNVSFVGNPDMGDDDVVTGDFKQYNIILRGGLLVRVGYNGTDMAEGKYSTVMDQYYFNYISSVRTKALVKGPDFATVKAAIAA
jgi:hypothetical protein